MAEVVAQVADGTPIDLAQATERTWLGDLAPALLRSMTLCAKEGMVAVSSAGSPPIGHLSASLGFRSATVFVLDETVGWVVRALRVADGDVVVSHGRWAG